MALTTFQYFGDWKIGTWICCLNIFFSNFPNDSNKLLLFLEKSWLFMVACLAYQHKEKNKGTKIQHPCQPSKHKLCRCHMLSWQSHFTIPNYIKNWWGIYGSWILQRMGKKKNLSRLPQYLNWKVCNVHLRKQLTRKELYEKHYN